MLANKACENALFKLPYKEEDECSLLLYNKKYFPQKKISIL